MPSTTPQRTPQSRVFTIEDRAGPANSPEYQGFARAMGVSWPQGDVTPVEVPSDDAYGQFDIVDQIVGQRGLPSMPLQFLMSRDLSDVLKLVRKGCPLDIQVHTGACQNPTDFDFGFDKVHVLEGARPTDYTTGELGALGSDQDATIPEDVPFTGLNYYEIAKLVASEKAAAAVTDTVVGVLICDEKTCGECGISSDGCQVMFALTSGVTGSPGLPTELLYSEDGGQNWSSTNITTMALTDNPPAGPRPMACVGTNLVVLDAVGDSLHYAPIADILDGTETWTEVTTGFVGAGTPKAIFSLGRTRTWIVGAGGYVYFSDDITAGVTVQSAGGATSEDLADVWALNRLTLAAVGANNAVIISNDGENWVAVTGPAAGIALNTVSFRPGTSGSEIWVGAANGSLYYTRDAGTSWTAKTLPGVASTAILAMAWSTPTVGYVSSTIAGPTGRVLRTISGGNTWVAIPEAEGLTFPAQDQINALAACTEDPNLVLMGGLADDGSDGFLAVAAA